MNYVLGIRREDKNEWEKRTPIVPKHVKKLYENNNIQSVIQPSKNRTYTDEEYERAKGKISEDLSDCSVIFAVKEIPKELFIPNKTYAFFSHVVKGQRYNMSMLREMMDNKCTLIDYEKIMNKNKDRLIFFGRYAGIAGMVDTFHIYGELLRKHYNLNTHFGTIRKTYQYNSLFDIRDHFLKIGNQIRNEGLPPETQPLIIGFAGYGNVSRGAQEILNFLPCKEIQPDELLSIFSNPSENKVFKVVFKEKDFVQRNKDPHRFDLQEYYQHPDRYHSIFDQYLPYLSVLMNCIYWDKRYPRLVTKKYLSEHYLKDAFNLKVIGDISVDINGAIEPTALVTTPDHPAYIYDPVTDEVTQDISRKGIAIIAVDNLPCELPKESSNEFSTALYPFIPDIIHANYSVCFDDLRLPNEIRNAIILYKGKLTPEFEYINKYL
jgi:alpha-aminoadipic semialdehyde synthase